MEIGCEGEEMSEESSAGRSASAAPRLLDRVHEAIRRKYFSRRTEQAYVHWIRRFIFFHGKRHPRELGEAEVTACRGTGEPSCVVKVALPNARRSKAAA